MKIVIDQILEYHLTIPKVNIAGPMSLKEDLDIDSLDCVEICMDIEDRLKIVITDDELEALKTVQDLYDLVDLKQKEKPVNNPPAPQEGTHEETQ